MAAIVAATTTATAAALELVDLFVEAVEFLLGELTFAFGFLDRGEDAVEVAHDGFEAVADAIDLTAEDAVDITVALVAAVTAATVPVAASVAAAAIITTVASATITARTIAIIATRRFTVGLSASFEKFVRLMRLVGRDFGNAFAFRRFINGGGNIFVFVTRAVFAFGFAFAIIVVFRRARSFAIRWFFRGITFARRAIVIATSATASAWTAATAATHGTTSAAAATAPAAFTVTAVAAFAAGTIGT